MTIRWGILSTAGIARKNWRAIAQSTSGTVVAVASRDRTTAQSFIDECQSHTPQRTVPIPCASYQELLERKDIDAVYIPLPTGIRKPWILEAAKQGKHILAEKPAALNGPELEEILGVCRERNVQYMDGVMYMHSARLGRLRETLDDGLSIGKLKRIACHFSFLGDADFASNNIRANSAYEPHGCLGDLGWYCIRLLLWANHWKKPVRSIGRCLSTMQGVASQRPVPSEYSAELFFEDGSSGSFYCSFITQHQQWAHFSGDRGYVWLPDFVLPFYGSESSFEVGQPNFQVRGCDFHMHQHTRRVAVTEYASGHEPAQEITMFETFHQAIRSGCIDSRWGDYTLLTQRVMDDLFLQTEDSQPG